VHLDNRKKKDPNTENEPPKIHTYLKPTAFRIAPVMGVPISIPKIVSHNQRVYFQRAYERKAAYLC
jgi:hypothetical protein